MAFIEIEGREVDLEAVATEAGETVVDGTSEALESIWDWCQRVVDHLTKPQATDISWHWSEGDWRGEVHTLSHEQGEVFLGDFPPATPAHFELQSDASTEGRRPHWITSANGTDWMTPKIAKVGLVVAEVQPGIDDSYAAKVEIHELPRAAPSAQSKVAFQASTSFEDLLHWAQEYVDRYQPLVPAVDVDWDLRWSRDHEVSDQDDFFGEFECTRSYWQAGITW